MSEEIAPVVRKKREQRRARGGIQVKPGQNFASLSVEQRKEVLHKQELRWKQEYGKSSEFKSRGASEKITRG